MNFNTLSPLSFKLELVNFPLISFWCQSVNLPELTLSESLQATPLIDIPVIGDKVEIGTLDITIIVDEDLANYREIVDWMKGAAPTENLQNYELYISQKKDIMGSEYSKFLSDGTLHITTNAKGANLIIRLYDMFPTSLSALSFDSSGESTVITTDISFQIRDYIIDG